MRQPTPWERRRELGIGQGLFQTWKQTLLKPDPFWASVEPQGPVWDALAYAWILSAVGGVVALPFTFMAKAQALQLQQAFVPLKIHPPDWLFTLLTPRMAMAMIAGEVLLNPLFLLLSAGLFHLACLMCGASQNGFPATVRVVAYASAPRVLNLPGVASFAALFQLILMVIGLYRMQETTQTRAVLAAGLVLGAGCCLGCGGGIWLVMRMIGT